MEERIEMTAHLLAQAMLKGQIKRLLKAKWGCSARTCEVYLSRARKLLVEKSGRTRGEHFIEAAAFYRSVIQSPNASLRDKLQARERLDVLYGLEAPRDVRFTGVVGGVIRHDVKHSLDLSRLTDEQLATLETLLALAEQANPAPAPDGEEGPQDTQGASPGD
jgi:hypothetical protein